MFFLFKEENKRIELLWSIAIEFSAPPVKPTNGTFLICFKFCSRAKNKTYFLNNALEHSLKYFIFNIYYSRAISTTRTIFRLNTNQSHSYEDHLA